MSYYFEGACISSSACTPSTSLPFRIVAVCIRSIAHPARLLPSQVAYQTAYRFYRERGKIVYLLMCVFVNLASIFLFKLIIAH